MLSVLLKPSFDEQQIRSEHQAHIAEDTRIQQRLQRRGGRTYGSKLAQDLPNSVGETELPRQGPILPTNRSSSASTLPPTCQTANSSGTTNEDVNDLYSQLADRMSQDKTFLLFRGVSAMNVRNILRMQS